MRGCIYLPLLSTIIYLVAMVDKSADSASTWNLTFTPPRMDQLPMSVSRNVTVIAVGDISNVKHTTDDTTNQHLLLTFMHSDPRVVRVSNPNKTMMLKGTCSSTQCLLQGVFWLEGLLLGFSNLTMVPEQKSPHSSGLKEAQLQSDSYMVSVIPKPSPLDTVFSMLLLVVICLMNLSFGCAFEMDIAKEVFKRPAAILVGFVCQYTIMPSLAFLYGYLLELSTPLRLGLLAIGCSPGGGSSNIFSLLLDGDLTLSLCMTFVSNIAALGMMPLWLLTIGVYITGNTVAIPFSNIAITLCTLILPVLIGMILQRYCSKIAKWVKKLIRPVAFIFLIAIIVLGVITRNYIIQLLNEWRPIVAGMMLPISALVVAAILATLARQPKKYVLTIAIETCVQNVSIALVILITSLGHPTGDIAAIMPLITSFATQLPLIIVVILKKSIEKYRAKRSGRYEIDVPGQKKGSKMDMVAVNKTFSTDGENGLTDDGSAVMY